MFGRRLTPRFALRQEVADRHRGEEERHRAVDWHLQGGKLDRQRVTAGWNDKLARALSRGYPGMRASGNPAWLRKQDWQDFFCEYVITDLSGWRLPDDRA